jgi:hypothetical protein
MDYYFVDVDIVMTDYIPETYHFSENLQIIFSEDSML